MIDRRENPEEFDEAAQLQEIDEVHSLAVNVFEAREGYGWSQEALAGRAGMTQSQIARIEAGHVNPTLGTLTKLACAFGKRVADLLSDVEQVGRGSESWEAESVRVSLGGTVESRTPAEAEAVIISWTGSGAPLQEGDDDLPDDAADEAPQLALVG